MKVLFASLGGDMADIRDAKVPDLGNSSDVPVIEVLVAVGDRVKKDQGLVTLESDKATMEVPAPFAGIVREITVKLGDALSEGHVVARIEVEEGAVAPAPAAAQNAGDSVFKPLNKGAPSGNMRDLEMVMNIPVKLTVELGRTRITIKQLLELAQGSVIELEGLAGEPMDILINGYLIAQGEVVVVDDKYGIRITEIITPSERVQKLNR